VAQYIAELTHIQYEDWAHGRPGTSFPKGVRPKDVGAPHPSRHEQTHAHTHIYIMVYTHREVF